MWRGPGMLFKQAVKVILVLDPYHAPDAVCGKRGGHQQLLGLLQPKLRDIFIWRETGVF